MPTAAPSVGRPIGSEYYDRARKLAFMDRHGIAVSVVSPANPWLDFLPDAGSVAAEINEDMEALVQRQRRPTVWPGAAAHRAIRKRRRGTWTRIARLPHLRGAIIGTTGAGMGLDDQALDPVWAAAERDGLMIFVHPHYGLGNEALTGYGHAMPLALGFPFETTAAIARLILGGTFDRFPGLRLMVSPCRRRAALSGIAGWMRAWLAILIRRSGCSIRPVPT